GVALGHGDLARAHDLCHHRHAVTGADVAQDLQALLAQPLEAVRTRPRLVRPAAQDIGPRGLDVPGDLVEQLGALDRAGPGDHAERAAADADLADGYDRVGGLELPAGQLERLEDRQHLLDAGDGRQRLGLQLVLVADDADDGAQRAAAEVRLEAQFLDTLQDVLDLLLGGVPPENDDHQVI